jgi:hypothetical protein
LKPFAVVTESEDSDFLLITTKKNFDPNNSKQDAAGKFTSLKTFNAKCVELGLPEVTAGFYRKALTKSAN